MPEKSRSAPPSHSRNVSSKLRNSKRPPAHLQGSVVLHARNVPLSYPITSDTLVMGRSDPDTASSEPFKPVKRDGVQLGLGTSPKLSRAHLKIQYDYSTDQYVLSCLGKNGVTVAVDHSNSETSLVPSSDPVPLSSFAEIKVAGCSMKFALSTPSSDDAASPAPASPKPNASKSARSNRSADKSAQTSSGKRKRREWTKSEHMALRAQMMRFGYGRWDDIIAAASGRLSERHPHEVIPVARRFVARCYIHARPGVERKALMEILRQAPRKTLHADEKAIDEEVTALLNSATDEADPAEQRKYVRWARKLRILSRLNDVHDHSSMERLRDGILRVFTPPPTLYWTSADDADLILGSYKHGYGAVEAIRSDPQLGFFNRYSKSVLAKKAVTPSKLTKSVADNANGSDEDEDDDEDADEDEDERKDSSPSNEEEKGSASGGPQNPKKRQKLGDGTPKGDDVRKGGRSVDGVDLSEADRGIGSTVASSSVTPSENDVKTDQPDGEKSKRKGRLVPKRGPRIGNNDGYNEPEDARAAHEAAADENGLAPFPNSEALMRRLKSIINSCAKEFDRDQRELRKKQLAASRARQRKNDLAEKKAIKEAERTRQRAERRIAKSQPFSKKEAVEFEKALANFGVSYLNDGKTVDWSWFHKKVDGFEAKYAETMWSAYVELLAEAHRIRDLAAAKEDEDYDTVDRLNETKKSSAVFSTLTVERAERLIDRLQFFRNLRGDVLPHPKLTSILRGFKKTRDLPPWWKSSHDKSLLLGVDRHGLNGWDEMGNDPSLAFASSMKAWQRKNASDSKATKRATMPKPASGIRRASALVRYFSSRANDPHFEIYNQTENGSTTTGGDHQSKAEPVSRNEKAANVPEVKADVAMEDVEPKVTSRNSGPQQQRKMEVNLAVLPPSGRPRMLRQTLIQIPKDENGILILPANLGDGLILLNLGEVVQGAGGFCRNGIIYPLGFRSIRQFGGRAYLCEILSNAAKTQPEFRVSEVFGFNEEAREEDYMWESHREIAKSSNIVTVWMKVTNEQSEMNGDGDGKIALACGPERFGLYEPTVVYHIQRLPGAKYVEGFELRDFSYKGAGAKIEPSVGILEAMLNALDSKLEPMDERSNSDAVMTDDEEIGREGAVLAEEAEMSVPVEWVEMYSGQRRKQRRRPTAFLA